MDESTGERDAGVESTIIADLNDQPGLCRAVAEFSTGLDGRAQRLLDQDVLPGLERLQRRGTWNWSAMATITASTWGSASMAS